MHHQSPGLNTRHKIRQDTSTRRYRIAILYGRVAARQFERRPRAGLFARRNQRGTHVDTGFDPASSTEQSGPTLKLSKSKSFRADLRRDAASSRGDLVARRNGIIDRRVDALRDAGGNRTIVIVDEAGRYRGGNDGGSLSRALASRLLSGEVTGRRSYDRRDADDRGCSQPNTGPSRHDQSLSQMI